MMTFRLQAFLIVSMLFSGVPLHIGRSSSVTGTQERANGVNPLYPYDRQVGLTLTENFTTLAFNVSAVTQVGPEGLGPAYLLNGLSDSGYWYQVGLSWDWEASTGFRMNYEVFDPDGTSIFPANGGGGLVSFSGSVYQGDSVLLNLYFSGNDVVMLAKDWNTSASAYETYNAEGASYFVGQASSNGNSQGFFSGLMTEQYYSTPFRGGGEKVVFRFTYALDSAWMWIDESNVLTHENLFSNSTFMPINYRQDSEQFHYVSSNGIGAASNAREFVTGLTDIGAPQLTIVIKGPVFAGERFTIVGNLTNSGIVTISLLELTARTPLGTYQSTEHPLNVSIGTTRALQLQIELPVWIPLGNYTSLVFSNWEFYDSEISSWAMGQSEEQILLPVHPATLSTLLNWSLGQPTVWAIVAVALTLTIIRFVQRRKNITSYPPVSTLPS